MPKGKAPISGYISQPDLISPDQIKTQILLKYKREKHAAPDEQTLSEIQSIIATAISRYLSANLLNSKETTTEQNKTLNKVITLSKQLINALDRNDEDYIFRKQKELYKQIKALSVTAKSMLYHSLPSQIDPSTILKSLEYMKVKNCEPATEQLINALSEVNIEKQEISKRVHWVEPYLIQLVEDLSKIWTLLTGRKSLGRASFDPAAMDKRNYFAELIEDLFYDLNEAPPKHGTIEDIITKRAVEKIEK